MSEMKINKTLSEKLMNSIIHCKTAMLLLSKKGEIIFHNDEAINMIGKGDAIAYSRLQECTSVAAMDLSNFEKVMIWEVQAEDGQAALISAQMIRLKAQKNDQSSVEWIVLMHDANSRRDNSMRDYLTKLPNRREAQMLLELEWARAQRAGNYFALAIVDIDFFKKVNDNLGHDAGDQVLKHVVGVINRCLRTGDWCARWGGEEFLILFANPDREQILLPVERIRAEIEKTPYTGPPYCEVTISGGIVSSDMVSSYVELLSTSDMMLYFSKRTGRNRITSPQLFCDQINYDAEKLQQLIRVDNLAIHYQELTDWQGKLIAIVAQSEVKLSDQDQLLMGTEYVRMLSKIKGLIDELEYNTITKIIDEVTQNNIDVPVIYSPSPFSLATKSFLQRVKEIDSAQQIILATSLVRDPAVFKDIIANCYESDIDVCAVEVDSDNLHALTNLGSSHSCHWAICKFAEYDFMAENNELLKNSLQFMNRTMNSHQIFVSTWPSDEEQQATLVNAGIVGGIKHRQVATKVTIDKIKS